ncbi:IS1 family transposase [Thalassobacillus sp. CUG 92003]|uniref:IS1 family transposase n=1 Tax=Thalassobacillus sp. CUG 92003 TaxID=2736641 RepID=UPI0015E722D0
MRKRWIFSAVGAVAGGTVAYVLKDEERRNQLKEKAKRLQDNWTQPDHEDMPIEEAGKPELDQHENSKMVYEGSQFGVQYYNELTEKEREILERSNRENQTAKS